MLNVCKKPFWDQVEINLPPVKHRLSPLQAALWGGGERLSWKGFYFRLSQQVLKFRKRNGCFSVLLSCWKTLQYKSFLNMWFILFFFYEEHLWLNLMFWGKKKSLERNKHTSSYKHYCKGKGNTVMKALLFNITVFSSMSCFMVCSLIKEGLFASEKNVPTQMKWWSDWCGLL